MISKKFQDNSYLSRIGSPRRAMSIGGEKEHKISKDDKKERTETTCSGLFSKQMT